MARTTKVLGQLTPVATTLTDVYTVPASTSTVISTISICNTNASKVAFRVSVAVGGAVDNIKQYIYYDQEILANDTVFATIGVSLAATDVVRVYSDTANVVFNLFGVEVT